MNAGELTNLASRIGLRRSADIALEEAELLALRLPGHARKLLKRACGKLGLDHVWFHDLRRSFVTNSRRRGVQESVVMRMSGHRTRNVFDRYNIVEDVDVRNAVHVIEAAMAKDLAEAGQGTAAGGGDLEEVRPKAP